MSENIFILKLVTGEEIIAKIEETEYFVGVINPVAIVSQVQRGELTIGFQPFPRYTNQVEDSRHVIPKPSVAYSYKPATEIINNYKEVFGGIVLPEKKLIVG